MGFHLNLAKFETWWPSGTNAFSELPPEVKRCSEGIEILKLPLGSDSFIQGCLRKRVKQMTDILEQLETLEDSHIEFTILRACLGAAKLTYSLRGLAPSQAVNTVMQEADELIRRTLERILGDSVDEQAWAQAGLAPSCAGLGLTHSADISIPAFVGSVIDTGALTLRMLQTQSANVPGLQDAAQRYINMGLGGHVPMNVGVVVGNLARDPLTAAATEDAPGKGQAALSEPIDAMRFDLLRQSVPGNDRDRLDACKRKHAAAWISCFPNKSLGLHLAPAEFQVACRYWLGMMNRAESRAVLKPGFAMYGRHHAIQECLLSLCQSSGVPARREVLIDTSGQRPADVYLPNFHRGVPVAIDVTVSHPSQSRSIPGDDVTASQSASVGAALAKVDAKTRKYKAQCDARGVIFQAIAICSFGGWLQEGEELVKELAARAASRGGSEPGIIVAQFWQRLSLALWRGNARQILHCLA